jgi:hypothetical protein
LNKTTKQKMLRRPIAAKLQAMAPLSAATCTTSKMWTSSAAAAANLLTCSGLLQHKETLAKQLKPLQVELAKQSALMRSIDSQALRFPDIVAAASFVYFVSQTSVLFYWVYFRFDWNLVEPITYLLGYSVTWLGLASYFTFGKEFTFDNMRSIAAEWKRKRLLKKHNVDVAAYQRLEVQVGDLERRIAQLKDIR